MLQNYSTYRILQGFFDFPRKQFYLREISRNVKLALVSVINHLQQLIKNGLVIRNEKGLYPTYQANRENEVFKLLKKQNIVLRMFQNDFVKYVEEKTRPGCIVLFGSASRGEDNEESDIDIFVQSKRIELDLKRYEKMLHRKINIFYEDNLKNLSKELLNNIINGSILYGYLKVL